MKEFNDQLMKFKITNDKLKMEISLKDSVWLFHNSPDNCNEDGSGLGAKVKRGKRQEFAEYIVESLMDESTDGGNGDNVVWGIPFEEVFMRIFEGAEDFCKYAGYNDED